MAHQLIEWVTRAKVIFPIGNQSGEQVVVGDVLDVGDWEEAFVEVYTLATSGGLVTGDISYQIQTALSQESFTNWQSAFSGNGISVSINTEGAAFSRLTTFGPSGASVSTIPPGKFIRLVFLHNVTTSGESVTVHVWLLLKIRTP